MAARGSRVVFVGNIPYEYTEEQLTEVFKEAGPVASIRLVFDKDTGRPKGYGFCEYYDAETAASAVRNLNNYDVGGRQLRVDYADIDPQIEASRQMEVGGRPLPPSRQQPQQQQAYVAPPPMPIHQPLIPSGVPLLPGQNATDAISKTLASMSPTQLYDVIYQMKGLVQSNPDQARTLLVQNPQLSYALSQAIIMMNIADPATVQRIFSAPQHVAAASVPVVSQPVQPSVGPLYPPAYTMPPQPVVQPQVPVQQPAAPLDVQEQQKALLIQVLQLTQQQIDSLPPEQRQNVIALKQQILMSQHTQ